jgi:hypothetical protein
MNYLHQGSVAPTIGFEGDDDRSEGRSTVWRLLWKDERYLDGTMPAEEQSYLFFKPSVGHEASTAAADKLEPNLIIQRSGEQASHSAVGL